MRPSVQPRVQSRARPEYKHVLLREFSIWALETTEDGGDSAFLDSLF